MEKTFKKYFISRVLLRICMMAVALTIIMSAIQSAEVMEQLDGISTWFFLYYLFLSFPSILVIVLAFVFPLGAFWAISQMQDDGEILAMQTVGITARTIISWVLECALLAFLLIWLLVSVVEPKAINFVTKVTTEYTKNHLFSMLKPNTFNIKNGQIIYANQVDANHHILDDVFMLKSSGPDTWVFVKAKTLKEQSDGSVKLEQGNGVRYSISDDALQNTEFVRFAEMSTDPYRLFDIKIQHKKVNISDVYTLWKNRHEQAALARLCWMTGIPLMTFLMVIMAACEMFTPPRATHYTRGAKFVLSMLLTLLILIIVQRQAEDGHLGHMALLTIILPPLAMAIWVYYVGQMRQLLK